MEAALRAALRPVHLAVLDESAAHGGHAGARPGGETHFRVQVVADAFAGLPRLARHRLVHAALADLLATRVHALAIDARAPTEPPSGR
jgi:BolA protein